VTTTPGTDSRNVHGHAVAVTVFSTVKWWGRLWLPVVFLLARLFPQSQARLARLSFIHFARWTLIRRIPFNGSPQPRTTLNYPHLYFESNFNGGREEYIDAFSYVLTRDMRTVWGSSYGFTDPLPTEPFKAYIRRNELEASHFWSAYPEATTTMVLAALELDEKVGALRRRARQLDADGFANAWRAFLTDAQRCL
jgi:hypothetical protein